MVHLWMIPSSRPCTFKQLLGVDSNTKVFNVIVVVAATPSYGLSW